MWLGLAKVIRYGKKSAIYFSPLFVCLFVRARLCYEQTKKCHWFFGELSEENAKEILIEAMRKNEKSEAKNILFLKTVLWMPSGQKLFMVAVVSLGQSSLAFLLILVLRPNVLK